MDTARRRPGPIPILKDPVTVQVQVEREQRDAVIRACEEEKISISEFTRRAYALMLADHKRRKRRAKRVEVAAEDPDPPDDEKKE